MLESIFSHQSSRVSWGVGYDKAKNRSKSLLFFSCPGTRAFSLIWPNLHRVFVVFFVVFYDSRGSTKIALSLNDLKRGPYHKRRGEKLGTKSCQSITERPIPEGFRLKITIFSRCKNSPKSTLFRPNA